MKMLKLLQLIQDNMTPGGQRPALNVFRNQEADEATIYLYNYIDKWWGLSSEMLAKEIAGLDGVSTLHLRVNSPGGDVFEGRAMRTALKQFRGKTIGHIDGLAASAATTVVDACDEIEISEGAFYMIHNGWTWGYGNRHELAKTVALLEKVDAAISADYHKRTSKDLEQIAAWMDAETWFNADEAVEHGFAHRLAPDADKSADAANAAGAGPRNAQRWKLDAYANAPQALLQAPANDEDWSAIRAQFERRLNLLARA